MNEPEQIRMLAEDRTFPEWARKRLVQFEERDPNDDNNRRLEKLEKYAVDLRRAIIRMVKRRIVDPANEDRREISTMISDDLFSTPRGNIVRGGSFERLSSSVPEWWTSTGAAGMTLALGTARPTSRVGNRSVRIQTVGVEGGIYQDLAMFPGRSHTVALGVKVVTGGAYVTVVSDGAEPLAERWDLTAAEYGASEWMGFPSIQNDMVRFAVPADATYARLTLGGAVNSDVYFCDVQGGQGPMRMYELWEDGAGGGQGTGMDFTPTPALVTNVAGVTTGRFSVVRADNQVMMMGTVIAQPVGIGLVEFGLSIPYASNFGATTDAAGELVHADVAGHTGGVYADVANDRLHCRLYVPDGLQRIYQVSAGYRII